MFGKIEIIVDMYVVDMYFIYNGRIYQFFKEELIYDFKNKDCIIKFLFLVVLDVYIYMFCYIIFFFKGLMI